jgi:hypothetical protein
MIDKPLQSVTGNIKQTIRKLKQGGFPLEEAKEILEVMFANNGASKEQAFSEAYLLYTAGRDKALSGQLSEYIEATQGYFSATDCDRELHIVTTQDKNNRRIILHRLVKAGILERDPKRNGIYRRIEHDAMPIEWETADVSATISLHWPFKLEDYALIYPKNIAIIAGAPNTGKTAFLLNFIKLNMAEYKIHYYSSEMGPEEMKLRLSKFNDVEKWIFDAKERSMNFADVVYPDDINIIDYIEITSGEFYRIAEELRAIFDKLHKGIAIIALQKKKGAELGRGAEFSLEKPRVYLSMDAGTLKIIKAKNWAIEGENPNGKQWNFSLVSGAKFVNIEEVA